MFSKVLFACVFILATPVYGQTIVFEDPADDANGPGTYVTPNVPGFRVGQFDLRQVVFTLFKERIEIKIVLSGVVEFVEVRYGKTGENQSVFMPVIDIYVAENVAENAGHMKLLPGRRVAIRDKFGWTKGVIVSAIPEILRAHYSRVVPDLIKDICFTKPVTVVGKMMKVVISRECMPPKIKESGFLILTTGLGPKVGLSSFISQMNQSFPSNDPFVRHVEANVGLCNIWEDASGTPCVFGGCKPCYNHPFVMDILVPEGEKQEDILGNYNENRFASVPFVFLDKRPKEQENVSLSHPRYKILSVKGRQMTIRGPHHPSGTLCAIVCKDEEPGGIAVVIGEAQEFLVLEKVDDSPICPEGEIEF